MFKRVAVRGFDCFLLFFAVICGFLLSFWLVEELT